MITLQVFQTCFHGENSIMLEYQVECWVAFSTHEETWVIKIEVVFLWLRAFQFSWAIHPCI